MNVNKVIIAGNLTRDPEIRNTPSGQVVASFSIATNRFWTDRESGEKKKQTEYHNVVAWRRLAEIAQEYLKKGGLVYIEGRLQTRTWEDQQGIKKYKTEIVAERLQMGPRSGGGQDFEKKDAEKIPPEENSSSDEINVEEIPF